MRSPANDAPRIRPIDPGSAAEIECVAARMRQTLVEVLGEVTGGGMYSMEWLVQRVRWHLDPNGCVGEVFVSEDRDGRITGHTIVRIERDEAGREFGLFSTFYVEPGSRNQGVASGFVARGERWMLERGMSTATTYTAVTNDRLRTFLAALGYEAVAANGEMVVLSRSLPRPAC